MNASGFNLYYGSCHYLNYSPWNVLGVIKSNFMKRPTWATVVGVLGIIFGAFGILGGGQEILFPKMIEMQKEMFAKFEEVHRQQELERASEATEEDNESRSDVVEFPFEMFKSMESMWDLPSWYGPWSAFTGSTKAILSALYLLSAIWILLMNPLSIKLFYWAAGLSILLCIVKGVVGVFGTGSFMVVAMSLGGSFGALIDVVLIIVVATADKTAFYGSGDGT